MLSIKGHVTGRTKLMANPLKILTHLSASEAAEFSKAVTFKSQVTMSNVKIAGLAAGTANGDAIRYEQLTAEESVRAAADSSLTSRLSVEESNSLAAVSSETSSRISGDNSLSARVSSEESTRASADTSLTSRISAEESARSSAVTSATTSIDARVSTEVSTRASADASLAVAFAAADTSLTTRLSSEESTRASADTSLTSRISAEESARASAIVAANSSIDSRVSSEESVRASADTSLTSRVSSEEAARASADTSLTTRLSTEEVARASAVTAEASSRSEADTSLTTRLSTEEVARASADTSIVTSLSTESSTRASADTSLSSRLSAEESSRAAEDLLFLKLDGTRAMTGNLNMGSQNIVSAKSGSFSGDVTVQGNLTVQGALTYLESTNTQVKDNQIELNYAAAPVSNANAGIVIKGSAANKDVKLLVDADGGNLVVNTKVSASSFDAAGNADVGGALVVDGQASVGAELMISGASFGAGVDGMFGYSNGKYSVDSAIRTLTGRGDGNIETYAALRHVNEVNLTGGSLNYALPQTAQFASSQLGKIMVDVLVASGGGWSNDLIAVKLETTGSYLRVVIDAPAHNDGAVRIIAVNEGLGLE